MDDLDNQGHDEGMESPKTLNFFRNIEKQMHEHLLPYIGTKAAIIITGDH
jgi:hypothetical protein